MDIRMAQSTLGGEISGNSLSCPGPNHGPEDRSLRVTFTADDMVVHSFSGDDWKECKDYVRTMLGLSRDWKPDPSKAPPPHDPADEQRKIDYALKIWRECKKPANTIVQAYLESRSIEFPAEVKSIRYHPSLKLGQDHYAAMVCLFRDIHTNEPCGVHRTFLSPDGKKIERKMLGRAKGAAIKLDDDETVTYGLHIGEGIETCLSAREFNLLPSWALCSTSNISKFPVLSGVECINFLTEKDRQGANDKACREAGRAWLEAGKEMQIYQPPKGDDWNDYARIVKNG